MDNILLELCPVCGTIGSLTRKEEVRTIEFNGVKKEIPRFVCTCVVCGEDGDFLDENDAIYDKAKEELRGKY
jgi:hypothetical protein